MERSIVWWRPANKQRVQELRTPVIKRMNFKISHIKQLSIGLVSNCLSLILQYIILLITKAPDNDLVAEHFSNPAGSL